MCPKQVITTSDYARADILQSDQLAAGLVELGIKRGDRVGIWAPNCLEWWFTQYGAARAGIILVKHGLLGFVITTAGYSSTTVTVRLYLFLCVKNTDILEPL